MKNPCDYWIKGAKCGKLDKKFNCVTLNPFSFDPTNPNFIQWEQGYNCAKRIAEERRLHERVHAKF